jgi:two-component system cell cycle sensor histidine kinase/response regulator CckA
MNTILVVEDQRQRLEVLGAVLHKHGYEVLGAENGDEALRMCAQHQKPIQILLCDVVTPGLGAREQIRTTPAYIPA